MKIKAITKNFWLFGPVSGIVSAVLITIIFTALDWVRNYGEVFRDQSGTNWSIVYETAVSWFLPTLGYITVIATLGHLAVSGILIVYRKYVSKNNDEPAQ